MEEGVSAWLHILCILVVIVSWKRYFCMAALCYIYRCFFKENSFVAFQYNNFITQMCYVCMVVLYTRDYGGLYFLAKISFKNQLHNVPWQ